MKKYITITLTALVLLFILILSINADGQIIAEVQGVNYTLSETLTQGAPTVNATLGNQIVKCTSGPNRWAQMLFNLYLGDGQALCPYDCPYQVQAEVKTKYSKRIDPTLAIALDEPYKWTKTLPELIQMYPQYSEIRIKSFCKGRCN